MKKLVFALGAVAMLSMVSCGKKENPAEKPATEEAAKEGEATEQPAAEEKAAEGDVAGAFADVPKFSNEEVQKFAEEYAAYYKEVLDAYKAKDAAKSAELAQKAQDLAKSAQEKMTKMSPDDVKAWTDWAQKLTTEVAAAAQAQ